MRPSGERIHRHAQDVPPPTVDGSSKFSHRIGQSLSRSMKEAWVELSDYTRLAAHVTSPAMVNTAIEAHNFLLRNPQISEKVGGAGVFVGGLLIFMEIKKTSFYQRLLRIGLRSKS